MAAINATDRNTAVSSDDIYALLERAAWMREARCAGSDSASFFPERGQKTTPAKEICASCPVTTECLQYALDHKIKFGIWGGLSERQRRQLRRKPKRFTPTRERSHAPLFLYTQIPKLDRSAFVQLCVTSPLSLVSVCASNDNGPGAARTAPGQADT